jgi:hypothetical protein
LGICEVPNHRTLNLIQTLIGYFVYTLLATVLIMKFDLTKVEFDQDDLNTLHDVIFNALDKEGLTNEQIMEYWNMFPEDIKLDALKWGVSDTPTRDNMYVWIQKNCC